MRQSEVDIRPEDFLIRIRPFLDEHNNSFQCLKHISRLEEGGRNEPSNFIKCSIFSLQTLDHSSLIPFRIRRTRTKTLIIWKWDPMKKVGPFTI